MKRKHFLETLAGATVSVVGANAYAALATSSIGAAAPKPKHNIKRGVSLYSYQEEFYTRTMTLEDCVAEASDIGAYGIEMLAEMMVPNFPSPTERWVAQWHELMEKYNTKPICYTQFQDTYINKDRGLTIDEGVEMMLRDLKLAKRLGFKVIRLLIGTPIEVIEKSIPYAEEHDLWIGSELHAPVPLEGPLVKRWLEVAARTEHYGLIPDFGIFANRPGRVQRNRQIRDGVLTEAVAKYIEKAWEDGTPREKTEAEVARMGGSEGDVRYVNSVYGTKMEDPKLLLPIMSKCRHIHGKFYEMTEDYHEYSIPYEEVIPVFIKGGYDGYICSEYEGQRHIQDAFETDSCEQVRRQHVMLRRSLGEV